MCLFKAPKPPQPPPIPQPEDAKVAADRELRLRARAQGFSSTILTSPLGHGTSGNVATKTILGA